MISGSPAYLIGVLSECDPDKVYELKERRRPRTLTQNAYYWAMLNKLAAKLGCSDSEVHDMMLRDYGSCEVFAVKAGIPIEGYFRYYDVFGQGWLDGEPCVHVRVYKGSSEMDRAEFKRLIDGMRHECEEQGIPVMTPSEIEGLAYVEPVRS